MRNPVLGGSDQVSDTNRAVQPHKMARGLVFRFKEGEILRTVLSM